MNNMSIISRKGISIRKLGLYLLICIFIFPDYFGIYIPKLPSLTMKRIILILLLLFIFHDKRKRKKFIEIILNFKFKYFFLLYIFVILYTAILRVNINTLFQPITDNILIFFTIVYLFKYELQTKDFFNIINKIAFFLCILGIIEYILGFSIFSMLETIPGILAVSSRDGVHRIMGPCRSPLAYGLYLNLLLPLIAYDYKHKVVNILKKKTLLILIVLNIFFVNSRLATAVLIIEIILLILISTKEIRELSFLVISASVLIILFFVFAFKNFELSQKIILSFTNIFDTIFNTNYGVNLGGQSLYDSTYYRTLLPKIFRLEWLNPLLGRGYGYKISLVIDGYWIRSIDNFYVGQYIFLGYPGLVATLGIIIAFLCFIYKKGFKERSLLYKSIFIACICYFISLWWVDHLGTLPYIYTLFGFVYAIKDKKYEYL